MKKSQQILLDSEKSDAKKSQAHLGMSTEPYLGTVGAIALDKNGNLAAATSTGGTTNKMTGRVGDSPIIGSGTYADNDSVAVSCTATGIFISEYLPLTRSLHFINIKSSLQPNQQRRLSSRLLNLGGRVESL